MRKLFAISFLFLYLFSSTELSQLLKTPLLIEHFVEHSKENESITLWQFLYMHYAHGDVMDADYEKDMKLPFKTGVNLEASVSHVYLPAQKIPILKPVTFLEQNYFKPTDQFLQSTFLSTIWQPPKVC